MHSDRLNTLFRRAKPIIETEKLISSSNGGQSLVLNPANMPRLDNFAFDDDMMIVHLKTYLGKKHLADINASDYQNISTQSFTLTPEKKCVWTFKFATSGFPDGHHDKPHFLQLTFNDTFPDIRQGTVVDTYAIMHDGTQVKTIEREHISITINNLPLSTFLKDYQHLPGVDKFLSFYAQEQTRPDKILSDHSQHGHGLRRSK